MSGCRRKRRSRRHSRERAGQGELKTGKRWSHGAIVAVEGIARPDIALVRQSAELLIAEDVPVLPVRSIVSPKPGKWQDLERVSALVLDLRGQLHRGEISYEQFKETVNRDVKPYAFLGKEPDVGTEWQKKASTDPEKVAEWFADEHAGRNIGVPMGKASKLVDFECDSEQATKDLAELFKGAEDHLRTWSYESSRGTHYIFRWRDELEFDGTAVEHYGELELRLGIARGTQSVFPPSVHISGAEYRWREGHSPLDVERQCVPDIVVDRIRKRLEEKRPAAKDRPPVATTSPAAVATQTAKADVGKTRFRDLPIDYEAEIRHFFPEIRWSSDHANTTGWRSCYALGREDNGDSAGFNLKTGFYKDQNTLKGFSGPFCKTLVHFGKFDTEQAAGRYLRMKYEPGYAEAMANRKRKPKAEPAPPPQDGEADAILERLQLDPVGMIAGTTGVILYSRTRGRSFKIPQVERLKLAALVLCCGDWILQHVAAHADRKGEGMVDMEQVSLAIADACGRRPLFDDPLGPGIWEISGDLAFVQNGSSVLYSRGKAVICEGSIVKGKVTEYRPNSSGEWLEPDRLCNDLSSADGTSCQAAFKRAVKVFSQWDNLAGVAMPELLAALCCCTWIQSTWKIRPFVSVCGATNCGKTTLLRDFVLKMFGTLAISMDGATAAAIRQGLDNSARPLLLDEMEHSDEREKVLKMLRTASRGGTIGRGSADGVYKGLSLNIMPWIAATENGLSAEADANRCIQIDMAKPAAGASLFIPDDEELTEIGYGLMIAAAWNWKEAKRIFSAIHTTPVPGVDRRLVEIYSVPVAMMAAIHGADAKWAERSLVGYLEGMEAATAVENEESSLLADILSSFLPGHGGTETVAQLLGRSAPSQDDDRLNSVGVSRRDGAIFINPKLVQRYLLKGTEWQGKTLKKILQRLPGAKWKKDRLSPKDISGVWGAYIPLKAEATEAKEVATW